MQVHRTPHGWVAHAPAKLNLFFEILARRNDGYHEIETLVAPVDLCDTLDFQARPDQRIELTVSRSIRWGTDGASLGDVPSGSENLAVKAVEMLRQRLGVRQGATLRLVKRIPSGAGLGGGSSDAAAALALANAAWDLGCSPAELAHLGAELGSDVPLFFAPGPALCRGRGERVEPLPAIPAMDFVVVRPPVALATADVYRACRPPEQPRAPGALLAALRRGDRAAAGRAMFNRLEDAAGTLSPWIGRLHAALAKTDCLGSQMSGSGSCCFGLCRHARHARRVARALQAAGLGTAVAVRGSRETGLA